MMKMLHMALMAVVFIIGAVTGLFIAGYPSYAENIQSPDVRALPAKTMANIALQSVAVDVRVAAMLQSGKMTRKEAAEALEVSSASLLMVVRTFRIPVKALDFNAQQGLCAAYVYINQGGYLRVGSTAIRNLLKSYLDKSGPAAIKELRETRAVLGQQPLKPEYAKKLHLKDRANTVKHGPVAVGSFPLKACYKSPTK